MAVWFGLSPVGLLALAVGLGLCCQRAYPSLVRWVVAMPMRTNIFACTAAFCCTSAFWSVWLLSGRGSHLSWLQFCGLLLFVVWPAIYFGMSCLVLGTSALQPPRPPQPAAAAALPPPSAAAASPSKPPAPQLRARGKKKRSKKT